jgi:hypothetical protein
MTGREVMRMLAPSFIVSLLACAIGLVLISDDHRVIGAVLVVLGAGVGMLFRMRLMMRSRGH